MFIAFVTVVEREVRGAFSGCLRGGNAFGEGGLTLFVWGAYRLNLFQGGICQPFHYLERYSTF